MPSFNRLVFTQDLGVGGMNGSWPVEARYRGHRGGHECSLENAVPVMSLQIQGEVSWAQVSERDASGEASRIS